MKKKYLRIVAMALVAIMSVLCIPGTFAKYSKEETYTVAVKQKDIKVEPGKIVYNTNSSSGEKNYTADKDGYYAVLLKGGNGGSGIVGNGSKTSGWKTNSDSVGKGGLMLGIVHLSKSDFLEFTVGQNGTDASTVSYGMFGMSTNAGKGGTTTATKIEWWAGFIPHRVTETVGYLKGADGSKSNLSSYAYAAGGGGGSSTVVYLNDSTPDALLMIAAGGGGSSGADLEATGSNGNTSTWSYGYGGSGGSNIAPTEENIVGNVGIGSSVTGNVYNGFNGASSKGNTNSIGHGGSVDSGMGAIGYSSTSNCKGANGTLLSIYNGSFKDLTGCGGAAGGIGGGGGGGFAGGGGGGCGWFKNGNSNKDATDSPGGGGGGSSFAKSNIDSSSMTTDNRQALANEMMNAVGYSSSMANGWVVVKELSVSDMMKYGISVS